MFSRITSAFKDAFCPPEPSLGDQVFNAVLHNDLSFIREFLMTGGDANGCSDDIVDSRNLKGRPHVITCANLNNREAVSLFLDAGAAPNTFDPNDGKALVHYAADWNDVEIMGRLLEAGADPEGGTRYTATPLYVAAVRNHMEVAKQLLEAGANPNTPNWGGMSPLDSLGIFEGGQVCGSPKLNSKKF